MTYALVAAGGLLAVLLTLAWSREFRLRRALQNLLARIFRLWRTARDDDDPTLPPDDRRGAADVAARDRLR